VERRDDCFVYIYIYIYVCVRVCTAFLLVELCFSLPLSFTPTHTRTRTHTHTHTHSLPHRGKTTKYKELQEFSRKHPMNTLVKLSMSIWHSSLVYVKDQLLFARQQNLQDPTRLFEEFGAEPSHDEKGRRVTKGKRQRQQEREREQQQQKQQRSSSRLGSQAW